LVSFFSSSESRLLHELSSIVSRAIREVKIILCRPAHAWWGFLSFRVSLPDELWNWEQEIYLLLLLMTRPEVPTPTLLRID